MSDRYSNISLEPHPPAYSHLYIMGEITYEELEDLVYNWQEKNLHKKDK